MKIKKGDIIVIAVVLIISALLYGFKLLPAAGGERLLKVELNGQVIDEIPFNDESDEEIVVTFPAGEAIVEIVAGRVRVLPMPREICPLAICSSVGWVEQSGDAIVCLPNRLVLTVVGGPTDELWDSLDGVTK
ncbi:MAG: NusG domain II-containing protein [Dethiobacter sp.]|jgi:hypothetical protein|nr:NusG domain II-containing protein [Dethiobacter sp.]